MRRNTIMKHLMFLSLFGFFLIFPVPSTIAAQETSALLTLDEKVFSQSNVLLRGTYADQITSILINGKKVKLDNKKHRWKFSTKLIKEKTTIQIIAIDKNQKKHSYQKILYRDNVPPQITYKDMPNTTTEGKINLRAIISEKFLNHVVLYPTAKITKFSFNKKEYKAEVSAELYLHNGENIFYITAIDNMGNSEQKTYEIVRQKKSEKILSPKKKESYKKNLQVKKQSSQTSTENNKNLQQEVQYLHEQVKTLEDQLSRKTTTAQEIPMGDKKISERIVERRVPLSVTKIPSAPGIYLLPFLGRENNYRSAARIYLHSEDMASMLASFNGRKESQWKHLLIPSPALFTLVKKSANHENYQKILRYAATQFLRGTSQNFLQTQVLRFLSKNNMLKKVHTEKDFYIFEITGKSGIVFTAKDIPFSAKTAKKLNELFIVKISKKGLILNKI